MDSPDLKESKAGDRHDHTSTASESTEQTPHDPELHEDKISDLKSRSAGEDLVETMVLPTTNREEGQQEHSDPELGSDICIGVVHVEQDIKQETADRSFKDPHKEDASDTLTSSEEGEELPTRTANKTTSYFQADYYDGNDNHQFSPLTRTILFCVIGLLLLIVGNVWAVLHSNHATTYSSTGTGQPVAAIVCSEAGWEECERLQDREQPCTLAIEYSFSIEEATAQFTGRDLYSFAAPSSPCHELTEATIEEYLNSDSLTIYYDPENPDDNHYTEPTKASSMSVIIVSVSCVLGLLFMVTGVLERML